MFSGEGEKVPFSEKKSSARGQVETWLNSVQDEMRESLQKYMKQGLSDFTNFGVDIKE